MNIMNQATTTPRLWTASFVKICLVNFFIFVNFHALLPTFPFFVTYLGGDAVAIGLATALFSLASMVSRPFIGWLVDTKGRCTMLVAGLIGMALLPMGYFVSAGIAMAVLLHTVHGAFHAVSSNASSTWVTDIVPLARMGEGLGMYGLSMAVSTAVAPALGLAVMNQWGFQSLFVLATLSAVVALLLGIAIRPEQVHYLYAPTHLNPTYEYGVSFERGTYVDYGDRRHVLVSGTASIDNRGAIVAPGDIRQQTFRMWENVEALLEEAGCTFCEVGQMIVYLRDVADYAVVKELFDERFPDVPRVLVWAPVCRPGWLIEMECMAVKPLEPNGFPDF